MSCPLCHYYELGLTGAGVTVPVLECLECGYREETSLADRCLLDAWEGRHDGPAIEISAGGGRPNASGSSGGVLLAEVRLEPRAADPAIRDDLRLRYGRALQRSVGDELRSDPAAVASWRRHLAEGFRNEQLWELHQRGQLTAASSRRIALAYTYFLQWRHVRQTVWALLTLFEQKPVLGRDTLRVLSLGGGPLSDAIALSMVLAELRPGQRADCLTVEHNEQVLGIGDALLHDMGAVEFIASVPFGSAADPDLAARLRAGAETGSPFLVITNHVFHQGTVNDRTLLLWADLIDAGTGDDAWFVSSEAWPTQQKLTEWRSQGKDDWRAWTRFYGFGHRPLIIDRLVGAGMVAEETEDCTEMSTESANLEPIDNDMWRRSSGRMAFNSRTSFLRRR